MNISSAHYQPRILPTPVFIAPRILNKSTFSKVLLLDSPSHMTHFSQSFETGVLSWNWRASSIKQYWALYLLWCLSFPRKHMQRITYSQPFLMLMSLGVKILVAEVIIGAGILHWKLRCSIKLVLIRPFPRFTISFGITQLDIVQILTVELQVQEKTGVLLCKTWCGLLDYLKMEVTGEVL